MKYKIIFSVLILFILSLFFIEKYTDQSTILKSKEAKKYIINYYQEQELVVMDNLGFEVEVYHSIKNPKTYCFKQKTNETICFRLHE